MVSLAEVQRKLAESRQEHLLHFWDQLDEKERDQLLRQLRTVDFAEASRLFARASATIGADVQKLDQRMKPVDGEQFESEKRASPCLLDEYRSAGLSEISHGRVGVLLLAGGQGTRLGVSYPKGMYSVGLPSGKTLFQIQAERIRRVLNLAEKQTGKRGSICWYIMTSGPTNETTAKYLKEKHYFGLNEEDVVLFQQGLLPCFDFDGKILLEEKNKVALSPDGNGGIYRSLAENGILDDMNRRGVKYLHVHSVDNVLVKVADPVFVGYCVRKGADCGAKVVSKASPNESVGVVCQVDGKIQVVEYSEIGEKTANLRDGDGRLVFNAGSICNHFFTTEFLARVARQFEKQLKLHVAKKKIPHVNNRGETVKPSAPNGIKIEKFIFDAFEFSRKFVVWEVPRVSEFSALKNADEAGKDCPSTARRDLLTLHRQYIEDAGGRVECAEVEISPLLSYAGENLEKVRGRVFDENIVLRAEEEMTVANGYSNGFSNGKL